MRATPVPAATRPWTTPSTPGPGASRGTRRGRISADTLAAYPPGIPNVLPGEVVTAEVVRFLQRTATAPNGHVRGALDRGVTRLRVVD
ncbi:hypothetical protein ACFVVP_16805 [Streptomyces sp. NPDC058128]|uniref:Orn/Lys/Arg family decarboxylase n=1 Tax=Streptomyces sp. NPDC058128 TaxID=3346352 RepID=UPI0036E78545